VERARLVAFGLSGALAGLTALLLVPMISVDYQSGLSMTLRGFIAAAISGMSPVLAIFAGFLLGLFEAGVGAYIGALYQDPVMFGILILVALWQSRAIRFGGVRRA
jgi:branched-chain amino acid transport system permease protein